MNAVLADKLFKQLRGKHVGGWLVSELINHGKSAVVFKAENAGCIGALKVFDPEIIERYGRESQLKRIKREQSLQGKVHPNLIQTFDGGEDAGLLYIAMEFFAGSNLEEKLTQIPTSAVRSIIGQISSAARFLEGCSFAHRDIKPANIGLSHDLQTIKLLDLGVIRPLDLSNVTDRGEQHFFVATLRYSPPELLFREESQTLEAWRAITFYQLGAVIHDLLTRKPLFADISEPYARLVRAVEREVPVVHAPEADADLRLLAQNCLAKDPTQRLSSVKWEDFERPKIADPMEFARRRIAQHRLIEAEKKNLVEPNVEDLTRQQMYAMKMAIQSAVLNAVKAEGLPRYSQSVMAEFNPFMLRVLFEPAPQVGAQYYFCIFCCGQILDGASEMQELTMFACVAQDRENAPAEPDPKAPCFTLRGALIEQDIRQSLQQRLLLAFAESLDASLQDSKVAWLNIAGDL